MAGESNVHGSVTFQRKKVTNKCKHEIDETARAIPNILGENHVKKT